jgi:putative flippase GtrA
MRFVRYLFVQVAAYGIDMGLFVLLFSYFQVAPLVANGIGKILAGIFAFLAHRSFTFGIAKCGRSARQAIKYGVLLALNVPLSALALGLMLLIVPQAVPAKFAADIICVFLTYWLSKRFVFLGEAGDTSPLVIDKSCDT